MSSKANNLLFSISLLCISHGFWVTSGLFTSLPFLFDLNVFSDTTLQPDAPGIYSIVELVLAGSSFLIGVVGSYGIVGSKLRLAMSTPQFISGALFAAFFIVQVVLLFLRLNKRGILHEWGWNDGVGTCADTSFTGCPVARYETVETVSSITDCQFNAFDLDNINNRDIGGGSDLVDWGNVFNYDSANAAVLASAANSGGTLELDAAAMPNIGHCWYWGCNSICNPRYKLNQVWTIYASISAIVYITLSILSFVAGSRISEDEDLSKEPSESELLVVPDEEEAWSSSDSISSERSLNFKLRM